MTVRPAVYPVESPERAPKPEGPTVFVRTFSAAPGLPWEQGRMAALEARAGAPLPPAEVLLQLRRLDPWFMGKAARYAAFYVRAADVHGHLESRVDVNGRSITVRFMSARQRTRHVRDLALLAGAAAGLGLVASAAVTSALTTRADTADRLDAVARIAAAKDRTAKAEERARLDAEALDAAGVRPLQMSNVLADLNWAAIAKTPEARLDAYHWDHGHVAAEARGDAPPFYAGGRSMTRSAKPLRPRVWLWGVEPGAGKP